jgi:hypothetical protein
MPQTGSSPEVLVGANGKTHITKWRTLGRVSHESAIVMQDLQTVYTTEDGTNCGLYMFKADKKADLSRGMLYAAKLTQDSQPTASSAAFSVSWIRLGYSAQRDRGFVVASECRQHVRQPVPHHPS